MGRIPTIFKDRNAVFTQITTYPKEPLSNQRLHLDLPELNKRLISNKRLGAYYNLRNMRVSNST